MDKKIVGYVDPHSDIAREIRVAVKCSKRATYKGLLHNVNDLFEQSSDQFDIYTIAFYNKDDFKTFMLYDDTWYCIDNLYGLRNEKAEVIT